MKSITLPKIEYETLRKKAFLYERVFKFMPERIFGVESYSKNRIKEFLKEDQIDKKTVKCLEKLLDLR